MERKKFEAILILLVPQIVQKIVEEWGWDEITASRAFYSSQVYAALEDEQTKLWHLSPLTILHMFEEERRTGSFEFPEEA